MYSHSQTITFLGQITYCVKSLMDGQKECCGKVTLVEVMYLWNMVKCWRVRIFVFI